MSIIEVRDVWKQYHFQATRPRTLKEATVALFRQRQPWEVDQTFWALKDVSLSVEPGDTLALIGDNGSGKSTLLKLITGISRPTRGHVGVGGRVSALLELGAGFHPDFTGRENVFINGTILGLSKKQIRQRFDDIVGFSELEPFIDQPVKTYSSGMYMRLGFAVAINVDPEILVIDEVLAVGDAAFQQKCVDAIHRIRDSGVTIVFVSHSASSVQQLCRRAAWLDRGELRELGPTDQVAASYLEQVQESIDRSRSLEPAGSLFLGALSALILKDDSGRGVETFEDRGPSGVEFEIAGLPCVLESTCEIQILRADGLCCVDDAHSLQRLVGALPARIQVEIPVLPLREGQYSLAVSLRGLDETVIDCRTQAFTVRSDTRGAGLARLEARWHGQALPAPLGQAVRG